MKLVYASVDFVLLNIALGINAHLDMSIILWYSLCILLGFSLRISILVNEGRYSHKTLFVHTVFTICWCFFMVLLWQTWVSLTWVNRGGLSFEIYLFSNSLFSVFMVTQFDYFFKIGFVAWLKLILGKFLAKEIKEDTL